MKVSELDCLIGYGQPDNLSARAETATNLETLLQKHGVHAYKTRKRAENYRGADSDNMNQWFQQQEEYKNLDKVQSLQLEFAIGVRQKDAVENSAKAVAAALSAMVRPVQLPRAVAASEPPKAQLIPAKRLEAQIRASNNIGELKEIQDKYHLIKKGDRVLDLGCAPGSFLQVLSGIVGDNRLVFGIDILPTPKLPAKNITAIQADIREIDIKNVLSEVHITAFDTATCDIAPNLSGIRDVDNANIEDLADAVIKTVREGLKPGGAFILKSFFTDALKSVTQELQKTFQKVTPYKPAASRSVSSEVYLICLGKR